MENLFHVFDRETLEHRGTFRGKHTLNTDGVWLSAQALPRFPAEVFYACDNDKRVSAFSIAEIAAALGLELSVSAANPRPERSCPGRPRAARVSAAPALSERGGVRSRGP